MKTIEELQCYYETTELNIIYYEIQQVLNFFIILGNKLDYQKYPISLAEIPATTYVHRFGSVLESMHRGNAKIPHKIL